MQIADARVVTDAPVELDGTNGKIGCAAEVPDFSETSQINVFQVQQGRLHPLHFAVLDVRTRFEAVKPVVVPAANFFPFCDRCGQFMHDDWPGKIHSDADFAAARDAKPPRSPFPVPPLTQPACGRTQKLRQNRCGYDAAVAATPQSLLPRVPSTSTRVSIVA